MSDEEDKYKYHTFEEVMADLEKIIAEFDALRFEAEKKVHPEQAACNHGITFDQEEADKLIAAHPENPDNLPPDVAFIMGPSYSKDIRKRWPRLSGLCPLGCGYNGIYYASFAHYTYGDW